MKIEDILKLIATSGKTIPKELTEDKSIDTLLLSIQNAMEVSKGKVDVIHPASQIQQSISDYFKNGELGTIEIYGVKLTLEETVNGNSLNIERDGKVLLSINEGEEQIESKIINFVLDSFCVPDFNNECIKFNKEDIEFYNESQDSANETEIETMIKSNPKEEVEVQRTAKKLEEATENAIFYKQLIKDMPELLTEESFGKSYDKFIDLYKKQGNDFDIKSAIEKLFGNNKALLNLLQEFAKDVKFNEMIKTQLEESTDKVDFVNMLQSKLNSYTETRYFHKLVSNGVNPKEKGKKEKAAQRKEVVKEINKELKDSNLTASFGDVLNTHSFLNNTLNDPSGTSDEKNKAATHKYLETLFEYKAPINATEKEKDLVTKLQDEAKKLYKLNDKDLEPDNLKSKLSEKIKESDANAIHTLVEGSTKSLKKGLKNYDKLSTLYNKKIELSDAADIKREFGDIFGEEEEVKETNRGLETAKAMAKLTFLYPDNASSVFSIQNLNSILEDKINKVIPIKNVSKVLMSPQDQASEINSCLTTIMEDDSAMASNYVLNYLGNPRETTEFSKNITPPHSKGRVNDFANGQYMKALSSNRKHSNPSKTKKNLNSYLLEKTMTSILGKVTKGVVSTAKGVAPAAKGAVSVAKGVVSDIKDKGVFSVAKEGVASTAKGVASVISEFDVRKAMSTVGATVTEINFIHHYESMKTRIGFTDLTEKRVKITVILAQLKNGQKLSESQLKFMKKLGSNSNNSIQSYQARLSNSIDSTQSNKSKSFLAEYQSNFQGEDDILQQEVDELSSKFNEVKQLVSNNKDDKKAADKESQLVSENEEQIFADETNDNSSQIGNEANQQTPQIGNEDNQQTSQIGNEANQQTSQIGNEDNQQTSQIEDEVNQQTPQIEDEVNQVKSYNALIDLLPGEEIIDGLVKEKKRKIVPVQKR